MGHARAPFAELKLFSSLSKRVEDVLWSLDLAVKLLHHIIDDYHVLGHCNDFQLFIYAIQLDGGLMSFPQLKLFPTTYCHACRKSFFTFHRYTLLSSSVALCHTFTPAVCLYNLINQGQSIFSEYITASLILAQTSRPCSIIDFF